MLTPITVETTVSADIQTVWNYWTDPAHIVNWNFASPDWECPKATNDVKVGGRFVWTMAAKDKSFSFDFSGTYTAVDAPHMLAATLDDGRKTVVRFEEVEGGTRVVETFDPETINPEEMQRGGWQAILNNFKACVEGR